LITCSIFLSTNAQNPSAYRVFTNVGYPIEFSQIIEGDHKGTIILFGELHDNPIAHWLQLELTIALHQVYRQSLVLGAEMFETDNQIILNEYLEGLISQSRFEAEARLWPNYKTDYKPLVEFAKENKLKFVASNIPRRYASMVASGGFEALDKLSETAKGFISPLPVEYDPELPGYKSMISMMGMPGKGGPNPENFPKAQAIKDATMAWNISQNHNKEEVLIHFHGTYHSNNYEGIVWYLNRFSPNTKIITIATVLQENTENLDEENLGLADFIIVVPNRMTRTY
jgi:uncharacterized iron-regulated protein